MKKKYTTRKIGVKNKTLKNKKNKTSHRNTFGGALIGQGNYGCIFKPEIRINTNTIPNTSNSNVVSKVVLKNNAFTEYRHEYKILKKLRDIDPNGNFHSLLVDAFDFNSKFIPADFSSCSLTKPQYRPEEFFVFNINFCGKYNLTYYLMRTFDQNKDKKSIPEPAVLFTLLTNIFIGIKKMISNNILHKTLNTDSIYLREPISLADPYCAKIIDYGDGELRKYKGYNDKNQDYISLFKSIISVLTQVYSSSYKPSYSDVIKKIIGGVKELINMVEKNNISYKEVIKTYILLLETTFGKKYSEYALSKYKV
jgi:hypothetical protein